MSGEQDLATAKRDLSDLAAKTTATGGQGVATSDELLDPGARGLRYFELFGPAFREWTGSGPDQVSDVHTVYDELRGIAFTKLRADAETLGGVHGDLTDITLDLSTELGSLRSMWHGQAAEAADAYARSFVGDGRSVLDELDEVATLIAERTQLVETAVLTRAQKVLDLGADDVQGVLPEQVAALIAIARKNLDHEQLWSGRDIAPLTPLNAMPGMADRNAWWWNTDLVTDSYAQVATQWLNEVFVADFTARYTLFTEVCGATKEDAAELWSQLVDGVNEMAEQPFGNLDGGMQTLPADAVTLPAGTDPVTLPAPVDTAPTQTDNGTGAITIGDGTRDLTLTRPDQDGRTKITIAHPDGTTTTHDVDLDGDPDTDPETVPDPGVDDESAETGADWADQHLMPDADGKVVIDDNGSTITVQQPDPNGPVTVTVDDGTGEPTTYTLEFDDEITAPGEDPAAGGDNPLPDEPLPFDPALAGADAGGMGGGGGGLGGGGGGGLSAAGASLAAPHAPAAGGFTGAGEAAPQPAAAAAQGGAGVAGTGAPGRGGMGGMPMMPMGMGMGQNGGDQDRTGGRWKTRENHFGEDLKPYSRIARMLDPETR